MKPAFHKGGLSDVLGSPPSTERWQVIRDGMGLCDSLHEVPVPDGFEPIPIKETRATSKGGSLRVRGDWKPRDIMMNLQTEGEYDGNAPAMNIVHEYGHLVDILLGAKERPAGSGVHSYGFMSGESWWRAESEASPRVTWSQAMHDLGEAIENSPSVQRTRKWNKTRWTDSSGGEHYLPVGELLRFFSPHEMFARAYTQWVAARTGNASLKAAIKHWDNAWSDGGGPSLIWGDDEFAPIASAMDRLFAEQGLLK